MFSCFYLIFVFVNSLACVYGRFFHLPMTVIKLFAGSIGGKNRPVVSNKALDPVEFHSEDKPVRT